MRDIDSFLHPIELRCQREALKYAVGRALSCPTCGRILDARRSVLMTPMRSPAANASRGCSIACGNCWDKFVARAAAKVGMDSPGVLADLKANGYDIDDGRALFARVQRSA